jgi:uncharacterized protein (TIGR00369 family)
VSTPHEVPGQLTSGSVADDSREAWRVLERGYSISAIHRTLGLSLRVIEPGGVIVTYNGANAACNRLGTIAGGAISEMIDSAVVQASRSLLGAEDVAATLELKVNFVRPARAGESLTTRGRVEYLGSSTAVGTGRVERDDGTLVAMGTVTVSIRRAAKQIASHQALASTRSRAVRRVR